MKSNVLKLKLKLNRRKIKMTRVVFKSKVVPAPKFHKPPSESETKIKVTSVVFKSKYTCPQVPPASKTAASPVGDCFVLTNRIFRIPERNNNN